MGYIDGVETVYYRICNMDKAVAFYRDVLGLELRTRAANDWAEFSAGGVDLALEGELATRPHQGGATVVLRTADVRGLEAHLTGHGVNHNGVEDLGGSLLLEFFDPDGNRLMAMQQVG